MTIGTKQPKSLSIDEMFEELSGNDFTVLDIETTGLSPHKGGYIIEIAAVRIKDGKQVDQYETLVDPKTKFYGKTIELTGITNEMVQGKPTIGEVLPDLFEFIGDSVIVAHNSQFDWNRFLLHNFSLIGLYPTNNAICTRRLFQAIEPERRKMKQGYGLSELVVHYGVDFDEANHHRALDDTLATAEAFIKLRKDALERGRTKKSTFLTLKMKTKKREKEKVTDIQVKTVRYWEKTFGKRTLKRVYVNFEDSNKQFGNVYYDIPTKTWYVKDYAYPIDLTVVEEHVLNKVGKESMEEYLNDMVLQPN